MFRWMLSLLLIAECSNLFPQTAELDTVLNEDGSYEIINLRVRAELYPDGLPFGKAIIEEKDIFSSSGILTAQRKFLGNGRFVYTSWDEKGHVSYFNFENKNKGLINELALTGGDTRIIKGENIYSSCCGLEKTFFDSTGTIKSISEIYKVQNSCEQLSFTDTLTNQYWVEIEKDEVTEKFECHFFSDGTVASWGKSIVRYFEVFVTKESFERGAPPVHSYYQLNKKIGDWIFVDQNGEKRIESFQSCW